MATIDHMKTFPEKVGEVLARTGYSQAKLAKQLKVSPSTMTRVLRGEAELPYVKLVRLADLGNVTVDYLVRDEMDSPGQSHGLSRIESVLLDLGRLAGVEDSAEALATLVKVKAGGVAGKSNKAKSGP